MANRRFHRFQSLEREVKSLYANVSIGASGAPTLVKGLGISGIVRDSAGEYTITLEDKYSSLLHVDIVQLEADAEDLTFQVTSEDVDGTKEISIMCKAAAVETDPSDGSVLLIKIDVKNSSVVR